MNREDFEYSIRVITKIYNTVLQFYCNAPWITIGVPVASKLIAVHENYIRRRCSLAYFPMIEGCCMIIVNRIIPDSIWMCIEIVVRQCIAAVRGILESNCLIRHELRK